MLLRRWTGIRFVRRAPTRAGGELNLRVTPMALPHVLWWHSHVQPEIDKVPDRVDNGWNWLLYVSFTTVFGTTLMRKPAGYTVGIVDAEENRLVPCALVQLFGRYPALDDSGGRSGFVWFLSTAPVAALINIPEYHLTEETVPKRLGAIALDVAVTYSFNHRNRGRVGLYADERGGEALLNWYRKQGMQVLPANQRLPRVPRRLFKPSDGRYCYFTPQAAAAASKRLDYLR